MNLKSALLAAALSAALTACRPPGHSTTEPAGEIPGDLVLRSYDVPHGEAKQVHALLAQVLWFGSEGKDANRVVGRSEVGPDGRLVVMATPGVQDGVRELLESMAKSPPSTVQAPTLSFEYWFVLGEPATSKDAASKDAGGRETASAAEPEPALQSIAPALAEIVKTDGPQRFTLAEKLVVTSANGERARADGRDSHISQLVSATPQGLHAEVNVHRFSQSVETQLNLAPGQLLVLGAVGAGGSHEKEENGRALYFILRAAAHDGQGR